MNNLRKFATEADYSAATLNYPAVSWVVSGDTVHFDRSGSTPVVNDKLIFCGTFSENGSGSFPIYNEYGSVTPSEYFSSITIDDVEVVPISASAFVSFSEGDVKTIKYDITNSTISDVFACEILGASSPSADNCEFLIPSKITSIQGLPGNDLKSLVVDLATPPTVMEAFTSLLHLREDGKIYVPDAAVNTYKASSEWGGYSGLIYPISQYSGNLPI